jgi:predicted nucleic acid-binding protein
MKKLKIYLDNCCFNRPYDNQNQLRIELETKAKLFIQELITDKRIELVISYISKKENSDNPFAVRKFAILDFFKNAVKYVEENSNIIQTAAEINKSGLSVKDSLHLACAIDSGCDYFLSTDDKITKHRDKRILILNPVEFILLWEDFNHD